MLFTDWPFPLFLLAVLGCHWALPSNRLRKRFLLAASYIFYAAWDWRFLSLIMLSTAVDFAVAARIRRTEVQHLRRRWLTLSLALNLGVLGFFKYFGFFSESAVRLAGWIGWSLSEPTLQIVLPVGISFYTFQTMSYTLDVYRNELEPCDSLLDFALFVAFFPQLIAGPIVRAAKFLPQLERSRSLSAVAWRMSLWLLLVGYFKKACVSDYLAVFVDPVFADPSSGPPGTLWMPVLMYAGQIFCDFSGYSDMAIGMAGLLGFQLPENFRGPYLSCSVREFWQRWHVSLSTWLRDYLYVSLGGSRGSDLLVARNLMLTMLLGGLWHGAGWTFLVWGMLHGLALIICRFRPRRQRLLPRIVAWWLTMCWVGWTWVWFRSPNVASAWTWTSRLLEDWDWNPFWTVPVTIVLAGLAMQWIGQNSAVKQFARNLPDPLFACCLGAGWAFALAFSQINHQPFIYFQF